MSVKVVTSLSTFALLCATALACSGGGGETSGDGDGDGDLGDGDAAGGTPGAGGSASGGDTSAGGTGTGGDDSGAGGSDTIGFCADGTGNGDACTATCNDDCGLHGLGSRVCTCTADIFDCSSCTYDDSVPTEWATTPDPLDACTPTAEEEMDEACADYAACEVESEPGRFCGCLDGGWDCDGSAPWE
jgi:hypothetical protein